MSFHDLQEFVLALEGAGELCRVRAEVDARLEITEIYDRVVKGGGPALLFENVRGSELPLLINPLGSARRIELALGRHPAEIGERLLALAEAANPPSPRALWTQRRTLLEVLQMRTRRARNAPVQQVVEEPDLSRLPVQTCWPGDGGAFITFGLVISRDPVSGERNVGVYRMQVFDGRSTGMHWQIQKGGGFHYNRAERLGRPLPVAVVVGADPCLLIAAVTALPEGMDEVAFSGLLRRSACRMVRCKSIDLEVPASAEIVLEGVVQPGERRLEGPFGDHFGHYSHAAPYSVFRILRVTRKRRPLYLSATVGKPPQEDKYIGNATQEMVGPLIKLIHPEVHDLWAYFEAGFHNLLVVAMAARYYKESVRTALALMGTGQLSLTKVGVLVDDDVPVRDFAAVLRAIRDHFDPARDFLLLAGVPQDTLDFTSYQMNLGSKMLIDATSGPQPTLHGTPGADREAVLAAAGGDAARIATPTGVEQGPDGMSASPAAGARGPGGVTAGAHGSGVAAGDAGSPALQEAASTAGDVPDPRAIDRRVLDYRVLEDCLMVVRVEGEGRQVVANLVRVPLGPVKIVAAVSPDVPLDGADLLIWGIFTRFDCARDVLFTRVEQRGPWSTCYGVLGIDATFKPGYPAPLEMSDEIVSLVDRRWSEYGIS